ncbi:SHC-transforming protein 3 isoform X2 [Pipistrellus kuhlii]|uniref:SHC-transforming protein 3 isoform X2 n=1 Tax=Pipistrellus kuhlii TaxID=59472 RepID=UPI001E26F683|nr:SHC-transforming protein 3 isoform X2 [Pipistrellus kuhlii]
MREPAGGMLPRAKYSRFRNDSVASADDLLHSLAASGGGKVPAAAPRPAPGGDGAGSLGHLLHRVSHLRLAGSGLRGRGAAGGRGARLSGSSSAPSLAAPDPAPPAPRGPAPRTAGRGLPGHQPPRAPPARDQVLGAGVTYAAKYLGCIEVLRSMRSLDFSTRTQITREAISRVCEAVPGAKGAFRKRKPPSKALSSILGKSNLQFAGTSIALTVSTASLNLRTADSKQIIANHHMQSISFASGGDPDTTDYVAYVAKDPVNRRACHILECRDGLAQDVIGAIGQAFELRFKQYLRCPAKAPALHDRMQSLDEPWTEEEGDGSDPPYYNSVPNKTLPPGAFADARLQAGPHGPDTAPFSGKEQTYYQGRHLGEPFGEDWQQTPARAEPFEDALKNQPAGPVLSKAASVECISPLSPRAPDARMLEELKAELWYQGQMSRKEAEGLLKRDGDFLVRKSTTNPGSFVLTGMHDGQAKHLLLVDPEGTIRTRDRIFDSISHLINHHLVNRLPIVSAGSELCLQQPVERNP